MEDKDIIDLLKEEDEDAVVDHMVESAMELEHNAINELAEDMLVEHMMQL